MPDRVLLHLAAIHSSANCIESFLDVSVQNKWDALSKLKKKSRLKTIPIIKTLIGVRCTIETGVVDRQLCLYNMISIRGTFPGVVVQNANLQVDDCRFNLLNV